ncbi:non-specific lipid transfer protein GPI-anchored 15-like [Typha angustifolia]|uniref:non-specific lipid transfer protein GPI-anchored 15-like n=1 Tax=Typha angustifolia TaxID=59011 RepID=UPI003C303C75
MAFRGVQLVLAMTLVATLSSGASGQSNSCTSALVSLSPCLNYITGNETTPSSSCCSQLASVVQSDPQCLCMVLNSGNSSASSLGINVNVTQALALPAACKVQTPPVSQCKATSGPTASPGTPSTPTSSKTPVSNVPSDGSKSTAGTSDANFANIPFSLILTLLLITAYSSSTLSIL